MVVPLVKNLGTLVTYSHTHSLAVVEFTRDFLLNPVGLLAHMVLPNSNWIRNIAYARARYARFAAFLRALEVHP